MLVGIIADLHANLEATLAVLRQLDEVRPDRIVCLGDLAGYNANPNEVIDLVRDRRIPSIMGNHDAAACGLEEPWFFNSRAQAALQWQSEQLRPDNRRWLRQLPARLAVCDECIGVHGALSSRDDYILDWLDAIRQMELLTAARARVCFFGHSHRPSFFGERGGVTVDGRPGKTRLDVEHRYFINPGSVGQPRDMDPRAAYGLYDTETLVFEFCRVEYDIERAAQRIITAGLPTDLAARLAVGR